MCFLSIGPVFVFAGLYITYLVISHCGCQDMTWQQILDVQVVVFCVEITLGSMTKVYKGQNKRIQNT